jgi:hypothetical protein
LATTVGTSASGINNAGQIVGSYTNASGSHSFLLSGGIYTTLDDPLAGKGTSSALGTFAQGINNAGQIIGLYRDSGFNDHGFLETTVPNPPPPAGTTADMILRGSNTSPAAMGPVATGAIETHTTAHVRFTPKADKRADVLGRPLCARGNIMRRRKSPGQETKGSAGGLLFRQCYSVPYRGSFREVFRPHRHKLLVAPLNHDRH